uniref:Uncharacterized protein n=3 Tax=Rhodosorus marinus TaxID=101924 RepID=A0A7S3EF70_9RHOD|mmetsp:Transcript_2769/g.12459  ORF Transcript_2769/g.12459 Transcript_2769/m.12459 type:complete len:775 (+) Transcript_2769:271-2595(+)
MSAMAFAGLYTSLRGVKNSLRVAAVCSRGARLGLRMSVSTSAGAAIKVNESMSGDGYKTPPKSILDLVDADLDPGVLLQPNVKQHILLLDRPNMPSIAEVAAPELRLAGFRINGTTYGPSRADYFLNMALQEVHDKDRKKIPIDDLPIDDSNLRKLGIGYVQWSPDGKMIAFCTHDPEYGFELWCLDVEERRAWCIAPKLRLNSVCGDPFVWLSDSKRVVAKFVIEDVELPVKNTVPTGPIVEESSEGEIRANRTYQDLLKDEHDVALFKHYTTSQLELIDVRSRERKKLGTPLSFRKASPSPDGKYLLVDIIQEPYSYLLPASRFGHSVEIWDTETGDVVETVATIPLQEKIPLAFDGVSDGPRSIGWRADVDATLYWAEAQDGGDPNVDASVRDAVFTLPAPFNGLPRRLLSLAWRYAGMIWGDDNTALAYERWYKTRSIRTHLLTPGGDLETALAEGNGPCCGRKADPSQAEALNRLLIDVKNWEDRYNDPGTILTMMNERGKPVIRLVYPEGNKPADGSETVEPSFLVQCPGASDEGDMPYLAVMDTIEAKQQIVWRSKPPLLENALNILESDEETGLPKRLLLKRESPEENPNLFIAELPEDLFENGEPQITQALTAFPHPALELKDVKRKIVTYEREDGVKLNASLFVPAGYDAARDGPLKMFMWAYPREFKSATFAGQMRDSPLRFNRLARTPLYWLTRGYAILDGPLMPVIGEGDTEPNDTYVEQLVSSAKAAVDYVVKEGIAKRCVPRRILSKPVLDPACFLCRV